MIKREVNVGDKFGFYTVTSEPFSENGYWKVKCQCKCGKIKIAYCCNITRLSGCKSCVSRDKHRKLKIGDKRHFLTFVRYLDELTHSKKTLLEVKCDCGNLKTIPSYMFGKNKTCGCAVKKEGIEHPSYKGSWHISKTYFTLIKHNAIRKERIFEIDIEYLEKLIEDQDFKCAITKMPIKIGSTKTETTASLDRVDNNKGYVVGNLQWLHKDINRMKSDFDIDYFKMLCQKVANVP